MSMLPRILSIMAPLFAWVTLVLLFWSLYKERHRCDWLMAALMGTAFLASLLFVPAEHRLFFDEDIYIRIASNLTRSPVAQLTLLGGPDRVDASTYYKEASGFPALLSLVFMFAGSSERVAFLFARIIYAAAVGAIYLLAQELT